MRTLFAVIAFVLLSANVMAQDNTEPEVRIIQGENEVIEEYRLNGRLYMVKVIPDSGVPYYFMDVDGDGHLEAHRSPDYRDPVGVQSWILFSW
ncbi:MAG: DUF2782 domain-containing protein [Pseudomonadota bacterium]